LVCVFGWGLVVFCRGGGVGGGGGGGGGWWGRGGVGGVGVYTGVCYQEGGFKKSAMGIWTVWDRKKGREQGRKGKHVERK